MGERVNCCIPGCRRGTTKLEDPEDDEIICGPHFRMVPAATRRRRRYLSAEFRKFERTLERLEASGQEPSAETIAFAGKLNRLREASWRLIKRQALGAAAGI